MKKTYQINTDIYTPDLISQAISDFGDVADIVFMKEIIEIQGESEGEIDTIF